MSVLIVDDHAAFRRQVRRLLEAEGYAVVGEAADGAQALTAARELRPDLVLLDVQLPDVNGFEVSARLLEQPDPPAVVLTSTHDGADFAPLVERCGALGFLPKSRLSGSALAEMVG